MMDIKLQTPLTFACIIIALTMTSSARGTCTVPSYTFPLNTTSLNYCPSGSAVAPLTECTYVCRASGYDLEGQATTMCLADGTFSSDPPTCRDIESPTISCQGNITTSTDPGMNYATVTIDDPVVTDNSADITLNLPDSYRVFVGVSAVRFEAVDDAGNSATCSVFVTVQDTEPPQLTCPADIEVPNDQGVNYAVVTWADIEISDNSGDYLSDGPPYPSGTKFPIGTTTIEVTASDFSSNVGSCSFVITVRDVEPPTLTCSEDFTTTTDPGEYFADVMITPPMVQDNSNPTMNQSESYPVRLVIGSSAIRFSAKDGAGNTGECTVVITVIDEEPPTLLCLEEIVAVAQPNEDTTTVTFPDPITNDNSQNPVSTPVAEPPSGSAFPLGQSLVTFTASDVYGNVGSCSIPVTILDNDECEGELDTCDLNAACTNIPGGFTCQCNTGYSGDGFTCEDIDECLTGENVCGLNTDCINTEGSYECRCKDGYSGDGVTCEDINECITGSSECHSMADCTNTDGSYTCLCQTGYTGDGTECTDIDECILGENNCDENAECINTPGSFDCQCLTGYSGDGTSCGAFDLCATLDPCPSVAECIDEIDGYACRCRSGYETAETNDDAGSVVCVDVDECSSSGTSCDVNAVCINTVGSYQCVCGDGFAGDGTTCEAVDPCLSVPCQNGGSCTSVDGSYQCTCPSTHTGINCNTEVVQNEPIEVIEHPASQEIRNGATLSLSCAFQNAESFSWKVNGRTLTEVADRSPLVITPALPRHQGYYSCIGVGADGDVIETDTAFVTMSGVTNYIVSSSFDLTYEDTLADRNSDYFIETAATIENFVNIGLQNTAGFSSPPEARVDAMTSGSVVADIVVFVTNGSSDELGQLSLVQSALASHAQSSGGFMTPDLVTVQSTVTCPSLTWMSMYGVVNFTTGPINSEAFSTGECLPTQINKGQPIGRAMCVGDRLSPALWEPEDNCGRNLTADERLIELVDTPVTIDNVEDIAELTSDLTSSSESLTSEGLESVSTLLEEIAETMSPEPAVCGFVIETVQNILSAPPDELAGAQTDSGATSRAVASLEDQLFIVDIRASNGTYRQVEENLAVEVVELSPASLRSGLSASLTVSQGSNKIASDDFKLMIGKKTVDDGDNDDDEEPDALIELPTEIGDVISMGDMVRCSFTTFADPALFQSPGLAVNENNTGPYRAANSPVISATVGGSVINGLTEPVVVSFKPLNSNATNATCVFWDFEANNGSGDWSTDGCRLSNTSTDSRPVCECDHLTNFAVLMDIYGGSTLSDREDFILEILSYVGCSMSVVGLVITICTYMSNRKFRMKNPNQILLCLCFSLLGLYVTFLAMISLDVERGVVEVGVVPCSIVAGLLHFFTLSSLAWMCVEGFNMYLMFVRVVDSYVSNFILKASACAWGLPAIVVFITAGVTRETYAQTDFCFVSLWPQVGGLLIPIGLILLFNIVVFALVMKRLSKTVRGKQQNEKAERRQRIRRFQNAICILLLMGLTWSVGYLSLIQATSVVVQGIFTVLNSLQGYFIFMLYCVRQPQVRRQWRAQFSCCLPESLRISLDSSTSRFSSTVNTRATTTWKPNNQPSKKGVNTISKFNPNSVPTTTTENLGSRMYKDRI